MSCLDRFKLDGKTVIVTGASRGLGRAMAEGMAESGAKVVLVSRTKDLIEELADQIHDSGGKALAIAADVTDKEEIKRIIKYTKENFAGIDALINNAGMGPVSQAINIDESAWDKVMDLNLKAMFFMAQAVAKVMIEQRQGRIINVGSALGFQASPTAAHYCTSKAGVAHLTRALALEWARFNINVNCLVPGFMDTEMIRHTQEDESQKRFLNFKIPMKRLGRADELIGAAVFLASDASSYVTGAQLVVDGGYTIW